MGSILEPCAIPFHFTGTCLTMQSVIYESVQSSYCVLSTGDIIDLMHDDVTRPERQYGS